MKNVWYVVEYDNGYWVLRISDGYNYLYKNVDFYATLGHGCEIAKHNGYLLVAYRDGEKTYYDFRKGDSL